MGKKHAKDYCPYCRDQGLTDLVAASKAGLSIQKLSGYVMPADGIVVFASNGLSNMDTTNGTYAVLIQNHSDVADEGTVAEIDKLGNQFTIVGPDAGDILDIVVVGTLGGQTS